MTREKVTLVRYNGKEKCRETYESNVMDIITGDERDWEECIEAVEMKTKYELCVFLTEYYREDDIDKLVQMRRDFFNDYDRI